MATTQSEPRIVTCQHTDCDTRGEEWKFSHGEYCSTEHYHRSRAADLLSEIASDHRFCGSCYKPLKLVYRPADSETPKLRQKALIVREAFVGFQTLTEHAEMGSHGIECTCGNVDHYHAEELCRDGEPYEWFLKQATDRLRSEGDIEYRFDIETFANAFWDCGDFELAVGRAITD